MNFKDLVGLGLLGVGAYIVYEYFVKPGGYTLTGGSGSAVTQTPATQATGGVYSTPASMSNSFQNALVALKKVAGNGPMTFDQWNYYYNHLNNSYLSAQPGQNTTTQNISAEQFLYAGGLSGVMGFSGITPVNQLLYDRLGGRAGQRIFAGSKLASEYVM